MDEEDEREDSLPQESLGFPKRLFECEAIVRVYEASEGCGILEMSGGSNKNVFSFFLNKHCTDDCFPDEGDSLITSAKLVDIDSKVPFISAAVWQEGEELKEDLMDAVMSEKPPEEELETYYKFRQLLLDRIEDSVDDHKRDYEEIEDRQTSKRVKFDTVEDCETELEQEDDCGDVDNQIGELFPSKGVSSKFVKFMNNRIGIILIRHPETQKQHQVLFNIAQVWDGDFPFLEVHSSWALEEFLLQQSGSSIKLNARDISNSYCEIDLQATAVWITEFPPKKYRNDDLIDTLNLQLRQHLFFKTGNDLFRTNPFAMEMNQAVPGTVVEYFSRDMGFVKLVTEEEETAMVVLFHLNQIWHRTESEGAVPYKSINREKPLSEYLPLGSFVMISFRKISAREHSSLRFQATCLWKIDNSADDHENVLLEFTNKYACYDDKVSLVEELDHYYDSVKSLLCLDRPLGHPEFRPVHVIINGLPFEWQAEVVTAINDEFGIIEITNIDGPEFNIGPGVNFIYAMFHIEDVRTIDGKLYPERNMNKLVDSWVDLIARPICTETDPTKVFDLQSKMINDGSTNGKLPLLQAIYVCVKQHSYDTVDLSRLPQPTILRKEPGGFGQVDFTAFYLNLATSHRLDLKLQIYQNMCSDKMQFAHKLFRRVDFQDDQIVLKKLRAIDSRKSIELTNGRISTRLQKLPKHLTIWQRNSNFVNTLRNQPVRPVYFHNRDYVADCGVAQLVINNNGKPCVTYAIFKCSQFISFSPVNHHTNDLSQLIDLSTKDSFRAHLDLAFPNTAIPYIILAIWNEDSRTKTLSPIPYPALFQDQTFFNADKDKMYFNSCRQIIFDIIRDHDAYANADADNKCENDMQIPDVVTDVYGVVLRVLNQNYAIAVGVFSSGKDITLFQVLFDTRDLLVNDMECADLGKVLADVLEVNDFIRFNAVRVVTEATTVSSRNLVYMATSVVVANTMDSIKGIKLPAQIDTMSTNTISKTKIKNFKQIVSVLNDLDLDDKEQEIIQTLQDENSEYINDIKKELVSKQETKNIASEYEADLIKLFREQFPVVEKCKSTSSDDKDNTATSKDKTEKNTKKKDDYLDMESICKELTPKQIRKLVMSYMDIVSKQKEKFPRNRIDLQAVAKAANLDKPHEFLERFFLCFAHGCRNAFKGMKVGTVFVTQTQVKAVISKGVMGPEHILRTHDDKVEQPENIQFCNSLADFSADQLRKLVLSYLQLIDSSKTFSDISKEHGISIKVAQSMLVEVTDRCQKATENNSGVAVAFKLQDILVPANWNKKICNYAYTGGQSHTEEIVLD